MYSATYFTTMHEPSDTTPNPSGDTENVTCENCGNSLSPMEWETLDGETIESDTDDPGALNDSGDTEYDDALHFCDEEFIADWEVN
jgi:hypothetical protein